MGTSLLDDGSSGRPAERGSAHAITSATATGGTAGGRAPRASGWLGSSKTPEGRFRPEPRLTSLLDRRELEDRRARRLDGGAVARGRDDDPAVGALLAPGEAATGARPETPRVAVRLD